MLDPRRLRLLVELRERGTVTAVADALHFTPSAVSQQLAVLEREAGTPLVRRVGRRMLLTEAGERLAVHAVRVLAALDAAQHSVAPEQEVGGSVVVAAFQTAAHHLVAPVFTQLAAEHPGLDTRLFEIEAELALPLLLTGEVDVVVADEYAHATRSRDERVERADLMRDELFVAMGAGHPLAHAEGAVRLRAFAQDPWAAAVEGTAFAQLLLNACRDEDFEPRIAHRVTDLALLLELPARGLGVALVPSMGDPAGDERVVVRPVAGGGLHRDIFVAVRRGDRARPSVDVTVRGLLAAR